MTIIEALKSGKRFRRGIHELWQPAHPGGSRVLYLTEPDIVAEDWETEEPTITITERELLSLLDIFQTPGWYTSENIRTQVVRAVAKLLHAKK